jgi:hypothetical protein
MTEATTNLFPVVMAQGKEGFPVVLHHPIPRCVGGPTRRVGAGTHPVGWAVLFESMVKR